MCDARPVFANKERFPEADEIVVQWPNEFLETAKVDKRTAICILTHDPKFDIPLLLVALKTKAGVHRRDGQPADPPEAGGQPGARRA